MNATKVDELDYIHFLIAAQRVFSTVEAAKVSPDEMRQPVHDAYTRLLQRTPPIVRHFGEKSKSGSGAKAAWW